MSTQTKQGRAAQSGASQRGDLRSREAYGIIRVIGCRIAWYTNHSLWTHNIHNRGQWYDREACYQLAQAANGLLVMGSGLVDVDETN